MSENSEVNSAPAHHTPTPPAHDDEALNKLWTALNKIGQLSVQSPADAEEQLAVISQQLREIIRKRCGSEGGSHTEEEDAQMADLMKMMDEVRMMELSHKSRKAATTQEGLNKQESVSAASEPPKDAKRSAKRGRKKSPQVNMSEGNAGLSADKAQAIATLKAFAEAEGEDSEGSDDDEESSKHREEARHQATVDKVMKNMTGYMPSFSDSHFDEHTLMMAMELLRDESVRESFVDMKSKLGSWLAEQGATCNATDRARYTAQHQTASALVSLFSTDDCQMVISSQQAPNISDEVAKRVAAEFNGLMEALNALGEAPAGLYSQA